MELRKDDVKSRRQCLMRASPLCPYPEEARQSIRRGPAALSEESLPYLSMSLDADIDMYNTRVRTCGAEVDESRKEADVPGGACDGGRHSTCGVYDGGSHGRLGGDSQLEYLTANEESFGDGNSCSQLFERRGAVGMETLTAVDAVRDVAGGGAAKKQNPADSPSECRAGVEAAMSELPQLLQHTLLAGSGMACDHEERAASLSCLAGSILESHAYGCRERGYPNLLACDHSEVKDALLPDGTQPTRNDGCAHSSLVQQESSFLSVRERTLATATQFCRSAGDSDLYSCEKSLLCTCGATCACSASKADENQCPVPAVLTSKDLCSGEGAAGKSCSANTNLECCESLVNVASNSKVNQAVDVNSDFRVCFTTSRSTSARVPLSSKAVNTEMTMTNKLRHVGCCGETCSSVACSTDWLSGTGPTEETGSQLADAHQDGSAAANERSSQVKEQRESKTESCSSDLKMKADRLAVDCSWFGVLDTGPAHLNKEIGESSVSGCCQNLLQRAIEAELQVLNAHYRMCYQHCLKIYKLALEENGCLSRYHGSTSANTEVGSSVMSVLEELKKNYSSMRAKIEMGTPLNALPPLSVQIKLLPIVSSYVPCKLLREELCHGSVSGMRKAGCEAAKLQEITTSVNMESAQTTCLSDNQQPSDSDSSKMSQEQLKEQGMQHGYVRNKERNERWFDAEEDFAVTDFSVIPEEVGKHQEKQDTVGLREAKITDGANECSFVCVSGLSSSVSKGDLRWHFQKYQISVILLCEDSDIYRCAFLGFKDTSAAKLAVEEMNKTKIKGKPISVELVNNPAENRSPASRIPGKQLWCEALSVANTASSDQNETLPSASAFVGAPGTSSASEKVPLSRASLQAPCSTQVPSEAKCPKSSAEYYGTGENSLPKASAALFSTNSLEDFVSPKALNLSSFAKLVKKLKDIHPEATRGNIVDALLEVRKNNNGVLRGLSISSIIEKASVILRKPTPACMGRGSVNQYFMKN